jgi:hypothetical protein
MLVRNRIVLLLTWELLTCPYVHRRTCCRSLSFYYSIRSKTEEGFLDLVLVWFSTVVNLVYLVTALTFCDINQIMMDYISFPAFII